MHTDVSGWATRLTPEEIQQHTASGAWRNVTLADCASAQAKQSPQRVAVVEGDRILTFGELLEQARLLAAALHARGLEPGDVISFQLPNWVETMILNLAACMTGVVVNPIVPIYREAEVRFILRDARAKLFFIPQTFRGFDYPAMVARVRADLPDLRDVVVVRGQAEPCLTWEQFMQGGDGEALVAVRTDPNAVKLVLYTSGTTGSPKGVLHSHNTIMSEIDAVIRFWRIDSRDVVLMPSPVTHITGYLYALEIAFAAGVKVVLMERWHAAEAVELIGRHGVTFSVGATPFLTELLAQAEQHGNALASLRLFMSGGAPVPPEVIYRAQKLLPHCLAFRVYGSTEAPTITLGIQRSTEADYGAATDGRIVNHDVRLRDPASGIARARCDGPEGEGEICARGPELMLGYTDWGYTLEAFDADGYFRTGDLGYYVDGAYLCVSGRKKDLIIRGGENISPKEIEDVLHTHPSVMEAAVVAMPHERLGEGVCAFIITRPGQAPLDVTAAARWLERAGLARQKFPERVELVDDLPRTASGKVQKNVLRARIAEGIAAAASIAVGQQDCQSDAATALQLYRCMLLIRLMEERLGEVVQSGELPGPVHLYIGQEAVAAGVCQHLVDADWVASTHRGHGHYLAKGGDPHAMVAEIFGRDTGICRGKGGSMHVADFRRGILGANGIVGGGIGLAVGAALAAQLDGASRVSVVFFGDGGANQGVVAEALNLAALWRLPLLLVCENNGFSEFSPAQSVTAGDIAARGHPYGVPGVAVDGNDAIAVWRIAGEAIARARRGEGPTLIEARTYRWRGHVETEGSFLSMPYRSEEEIESWRKRDPIQQLEQHLRAVRAITTELGRVRSQIEAVVQSAFSRALADPLPPEAIAFEHMLSTRRDLPPMGKGS